jgi:hypothetical protein
VKLWLALIASSTACAGAKPPEASGPRYTAVPPPAPGPPATVSLENKRWADVRSARYSVVVPLPERSSWIIDDTRAQWFTARHDASRSELTVRTWRASRIGTRDECLVQLRLWRPELPDPDKEPESVFETRKLGAPADYDTLLTLGVRRVGKEGDIEGYALAVGHDVGSCFAAVYLTQARGTGADDAVAARLALIGDRVLTQVRRIGVEDRVPLTP